MMTKNHFLLKTYSPVGEITLNNHTNNYIITESRKYYERKKTQCTIENWFSGEATGKPSLKKYYGIPKYE